ncbi:unnamed protein product [Anisakis simplex]|uniref:Major facilitator superfamily domain-containing protein 12-like n=1 Tax=Anisakis simplex TaxID=6269 RepID=A0A0M3K164_ANISI|nr:unnamed protein product [Anisakis simplex]
MSTHDGCGDDNSSVQQVRDTPVTPSNSTRVLVHETTVEPINDRDISMLHMIGYGIGHFYNDLCASMWFTYLMLFFEKVLNFKSSLAGALMLIGQVTDAVSTPLVGMASDGSLMPSFLLRFGRRISWHAIGTICVSISFPFIFNKCFACCSTTSEGWRLVWFLPFIMLFQFGWASVQISHLALIPELSGTQRCRSIMGSIRYSFTVVANLSVFGLLAIFLNSGTQRGISSADLVHFRNSALIVIGAGLFTSFIFYLTTREPQSGRRMSRLNSITSEASIMMKMSWRNWFRYLQFYEIAILYMLSRLYINVSQVYFPFYITLAQNYPKQYVAILPIVSYTSSFIVSSIISAPSIVARINRKALYMTGCAVGLGNCAWMFFPLHSGSIYVVAILLGIAQAILLVTSLAITADLINMNTESGAFVYGTMSFLDKLANGLAYQIIQLLAPDCDLNASGSCEQFYRKVMVFVPGGCLVLAVIICVTLIPQKIGKRSKHHRHSIHHCGL